MSGSPARGADRWPDGPTTRVEEAWTLDLAEIAFRHRAHAREHVAAASALEAAEFGECLTVPHDVRGECPVLRSIERIEAIDGGIRITVRPGIVLEEAMAHLRCHQAFGRARGFEDMPSCPLYVRGVQIRENAKNGIDIIGLDAKAVEQLQRRALGEGWTTPAVGPAAHSSTPE